MNEGISAQGAKITALGRYKLLRLVGRGGMGEVWLSEDPSLHRQVAIKTLPAHNKDDQEYLQRFVCEAQAAASLNHPHIVPVHDYPTNCATRLCKSLSLSEETKAPQNRKTDGKTINLPETQIDSKTRQFSSLQKRVAFSLAPSLYIMECAWLTLNFRESEAGDGTQRRESSNGS